MARFRPVLQRLVEVFTTGSMTEVLSLFAQNFEPRVFDLQDLLVEERRHILSAVIEDILARFEGTYRLLVDENKKLMTYLLKACYPMPHAFRLALESVLGRDLHLSLTEFQKDESRTGLLKRVHGDAHMFNVVLNWAGVGQIVQHRLEAHMDLLSKEPTIERGRQCLALLDLTDELELPLSLWAAENAYFSVWHRTLRPQVVAAPDRADHRVYRALADRLRLVA